jgi:putative heme degradation protein
MTLAPEHELVAKITTPEQKAAVEAYVERTAKRSERERMADVKTISGCLQEHMLNILYQRASSGLDWGLCLGRIRNRSCYGSSLWRRKRLCFC